MHKVTFMSDHEDMCFGITKIWDYKSITKHTVNYPCIQTNIYHIKFINFILFLNAGEYPFSTSAPFIVNFI